MIKFFLILTGLCFSAVLAQENEAPTPDFVLRMSENLPLETAIDEASLKRVEGEFTRITELNAGLRTLTASAPGSRETGKLLQDAFQTTRDLNSGISPVTLRRMSSELSSLNAILIQIEEKLQDKEISAEERAAVKDLEARVKKSRALKEQVANEANQVISLSEELRAFVMPRIFWFRSSQSISTRTVVDAKKELESGQKVLSSLAEVTSKGAVPIFSTQSLGLLALLLIGLPLLFFWTGRLLAKTTPAEGRGGHRRLLALGSFVRAFFPGVVLIALSFFFRSTDLPEVLQQFGSEFLRRLGLVSLILLPSRAFLAPGGLAVRVFTMTEEVAAWFKGIFTKLTCLFIIILVIPRTIAALIPDWETITFLAKFLFRTLAIIVIATALQRRRALAQYVKVVKGRRSFLWKNWNLFVGLILILLIGSQIGDIMGYRFAADAIFRSLITTAFLSFVLFTLYRIVEAGALKLSAAHAIAWDEAVTEEAPPPEREGQQMEAVTQPGFDEESKTRTTRLVRTVFLVVAVLSLIGIWNSDGSLFYALDRIRLFSIGGTPFTLASLGSTIVTLALAISFLKSLPCAFELFVFPRFDVDSGLRYAIVAITRYLLLFIIALVLLTMLQVNLASLGWLVAALGVGLGFGLQEIVSNFVSGIIILLERPIKVGDVVTVDNQSGSVSRIQIRATTITNWDRQELIIPNKDFITKTVINWTLSNQLTRIIIPIGVAYGTDPERVKKLLKEVADADPRITQDPGPMALFRHHGASSLDFELRVYIPELADRIWVEDSLTTEINRVLNRENIEIPFPQQDVYLREIPKPSEEA